MQFPQICNYSTKLHKIHQSGETNVWTRYIIWIGGVVASLKISSKTQVFVWAGFCKRLLAHFYAYDICN